MELNLKDRVAVVTGGAEGIGKAIAKGLAAEGCAIWILDRNGGAAQSTAATIGAKAATLDVSDAAAVAQVFQNLGRLDILVNAAGVLYCVKAAIPTLRKQHYGRIINLASVSALRGGGSIGNTLYGATKAGVAALTMGLARELGGDGITVNAIAPAVADTAMTHAALTDEARQKILARIPLGRLASLSDIADLAVFLASDRAGFITGAVIPVDGGVLTT